MNSNGLLSFGQPYTFPPTSLSSYPPGINEGVPIVAPFYAEIDTTLQGSISVMEVKDTQLIDTVLSLINMSFEQTTEFSPSSIYNISWEGVVSKVYELDTVSSGPKSCYCVVHASVVTSLATQKLLCYSSNSIHSMWLNS